LRTAAISRRHGSRIASTNTSVQWVSGSVAAVVPVVVVASPIVSVPVVVEVPVVAVAVSRAGSPAP
jgi:hypothetical protein